MFWRNYFSAILFINAKVVGSHGVFASSLRVKMNIIDALDVKPQSNDVVVDLQGAYIFPGLINAHDHLELNHYGRVKFRERYKNASRWVEDMSAQLVVNDMLIQGKSKLLSDRLFIGGLKNLLSGVTTVAHHNPFYKELRQSFPVRVVQNYGWAHSLYLQSGKAGANGEQAGDVLLRYQKTPKKNPFMIHAAEGVDEFAKSEFKKIKDLGCLGANTVLIHGVGLGLDDWVYMNSLGGGLVWCPASNIFLLGETLSARNFLDAVGNLKNVALGSDSRLTGSRDLLEEMRQATEFGDVTPKEIFCMVTENPAKMLRLPNAGALSVGFPADLLIVPPLHGDPFKTLTLCSRKDVLLVVVDGQPRYGDLQLSDVFAALKVKSASVQVDGKHKLLGRSWARRIQKCSISEPDVTCLRN